MASADTSCVVRRNEGGKVDDDVLETVERIGGKLACVEGGESVVVESLRELQRVRMTFEALEATKIGRAVNALRKTASTEELYTGYTGCTGWKALADERFSTSKAQQPPPPGISKGSSSLPAPPLVDAKLAARPEGQLEMAPRSVVVEATPGTKLRLHEVFDSAVIVKKPKSLPVINTTNTPGKAEQPQRRVTVVVRRTAAIPEPAPESNTARRNGGGSNSSQQDKCPATASHQGTKAAAKRVSPTGAAASMTAKPPTATALPKPVVGSSGACKRKAEAPAVFDEARLAKARARLHGRYKEVEAAKEKTKIKEIKSIDALGKKMARQGPARQVRCTAAQRTGKPVPCPRMPRANFVVSVTE